MDTPLITASLKPAMTSTESSYVAFTASSHRGPANNLSFWGVGHKKAPESHLFVRSAWRELLEHFVHALVQVLNVLVGVAGERVARGASPD